MPAIALRRAIRLDFISLHCLLWNEFPAVKFANLHFECKITR